MPRARFNIFEYTVSDTEIYLGEHFSAAQVFYQKEWTWMFGLCV